MSKILIVDINNFAQYPTLAVGYLTPPLRTIGHDVDVLSPLSIGAPPIEREREENWRDDIERRIKFASNRIMQKLHEPLYKLLVKLQTQKNRIIFQATSDRIDKNTPDVILLSAYLDKYAIVKMIASLAHSKNIPVILGGPAFSNQRRVYGG